MNYWSLDAKKKVTGFLKVSVENRCELYWEKRSCITFVIDLLFTAKMDIKM